MKKDLPKIEMAIMRYLKKNFPNEINEALVLLMIIYARMLKALYVNAGVPIENIYKIIDQVSEDLKNYIKDENKETIN